MESSLSTMSVGLLNHLLHFLGRSGKTEIMMKVHKKLCIDESIPLTNRLLGPATQTRNWSFCYPHFLFGLVHLNYFAPFFIQEIQVSLHINLLVINECQL